MARCCYLFLITLIFTSLKISSADSKISDVVYNRSKESAVRDPSVFLAIIARNAAHLLPNWLAYIENLDYPKNRMSVWIRSDHNEDKTSKILQEWSQNVKHLYHRVLVNVSDTPHKYDDAVGPAEWPDSRYRQMMYLRQKALDSARKQWVDYLFFVDCDNFLMNPKTLRLLMEEKRTVITPMIEVFGGKAAYSNFWGGMDEDGYYARSDNYFPMLQREEKGCFEVPMIHSTMLIDLRKTISDQLRYNPPLPSYHGEEDDILVFAHSAREAGIKLNLLNKEVYGYMLSPSIGNSTLEDMKVHFTHVKLEWFVDHPEELMPVSSHITVEYTPPGKLGFDEIYLINLKRRPVRRKRMLASLKELGIKVKMFDAVDGKSLTDQQVKDMGIKMLPGYKDPYGKRPLTMGEIGCFLSHYLIWEEMINNGLDKVLVLEDDVRFEPDFRNQLQHLLQEANALSSEYPWELIYIGRKRFHSNPVTMVPGASALAWAEYTYWTLGYAISLRGARKLVSAKPLEKMIAVDEFLPIMFNKHLNPEWANHFYPRNLVAMTAEPLLLYPTHYVGDEGYFSDTETTGLIPPELQQTDTLKGKVEL